MMKIAAKILLLMLASTSSLAQCATEVARPGKATKKPAVPNKTEAEITAEQRRRQALDLLRRSHALNEQISEEKKVELLDQQVHIAGRLDKKLALVWARELFDIGARLQPRAGFIAQIEAVARLSPLDAAEALSMLTRIDPSFVESSVSEFPAGRMFPRAVTNAFTSYAREKGKSSIPEIMRVADSLGDKGQYPYSSVMSAVRSLNDGELSAKISTVLITRFQSRADAPISGYDFTEMLLQSEKAISKELLKPAVDAVAEALENYPVNDRSKDYGVTMTFKEESVKAHGPVEIGLLRLAPLLKRVDPELWGQLVKKYVLLAAPAAAKDWTPENGGRMSMSLGSRAPSGTSPQDQREATVAQLYRLARKDPEQGAKAIAAVNDPSVRAEAYTYVAQELADRDPERAARKPKKLRRKSKTP
jgi:hypothetical protein